MRENWTERKLKDEALKFQHRNDFKKESPKAYDRARKLKLLEVICVHMTPQRETWTVKMIQEEAKKYTRRIDFQKFSPKAYDAARHHGILNKVCNHMISERIQWNDKLVIEEARKFNSKKEFKQNSIVAYRYACEKKMIKEITSHMANSRKEWSLESIFNEAKKFQTRAEFQIGSRCAYSAARKAKILEEVCAHMDIVGSLKERCIYVISFPNEKSFYVGLTYNFNARLQSHKIQSSNTAVRKLMEQRSPFEAKVLKSNIPMKDAGKYEEQFRLHFENEGYNCLNAIKTGGLGSSKLFWTKERIYKEAKKYSTRTEFRNGSPGSYDAAKELAMIDDVCAHMKILMTKWDESKILIAAQNFTSTKELLKNARNVYQAAYNRGIIEKLKNLYGE
jgi:predicted GIY-YIG superfamily endonuclease